MGLFRIKPWFGRLPLWRRRVFLALLICGEAFVLLAVAEWGLRVAGYGYSTDPFIKKKHGGEQVYLLNDRYYRQFFSGGNQAPNAFDFPNTTVVRKQKPAGTYRVFLFGSSAAYGWFFPDYGMGNILEAMLRAKYPRCRFEVVTVAFHAMNSFTMRYLAQVCAELEPDLFVVYMGNNEMVGPYGLESVVGRKVISAGTMRRIVRANLFLSNVRLYQLVGVPAQGIFSKSVAGLRWGGHAGVTATDDPRLERAYSVYRDNLESICESARRAGSQTALCTMGYNLRDWPPTVSGHRKPLSPLETLLWDIGFHAGRYMEETRAYQDAICSYENAACIDDTHAELMYNLGRCYRAAGDNARGRQYFLRAVDNALSFCSANTRINSIIGSVAAARRDDGVRLVDTAQALAARSPDGIEGNEFFYDHVHFTFEGNYVVAGEIFRRIEDLVREKGHVGPDQATEPPSLEECIEMMGYSPGVRLLEIRELLRTNAIGAEHPITPQLKSRQRELEASIEGPLTEAIAKADLQGLALDGANARLRYRHVQRLNELARGGETLEHARRLVQEAPCNWQYKTALMWAAAQADKEEARRQCDELLALYPEFAGIQATTGYFLQSTGDTEMAGRHFRKAVGMNSRNGSYLAALGGTMARSGHFRRAGACFMKAIALDPETANACVEELRSAASSFQQTGQWDKAVEGLRTLLRVKPDLDAVRVQLADALCRAKDYDAAWREIVLCQQRSVDVPAELLDRLKRDSGRDR